MAFELDHTESLRETWIWRKAPQLLMLIGALLLVGGEGADWWWRQSLQHSRCTVVSAKVEGEIVVTPEGRRGRQARGRWVEHSVVEFLVEGVGPRRSVQPFTDFAAGQVRDCWVSRKEVYLYPEVDRLKGRWLRAMETAILLLSGLVWLWRRRSALAQSD